MVHKTAENLVRYVYTEKLASQAVDGELKILLKINKLNIIFELKDIIYILNVIYQIKRVI